MSARLEGDAAHNVSFPVEELRKQFPALERSAGFVFADNAAGAQIPQRVLDAVDRHLVDHNVQRGGRYRHSIAVDATIARARASLAAFVNARRPEEIAFGMNATSFIRLVSLAVGQTLAQRNEIVLTDLDHEANVATWLVLERFGARFQWWKSRSDGALHIDDLKPLLSSRTRLVACTLTSNALGSIVDVRAAADLVHAAGAEIFLDGVHYAPHGPIDVQAWHCDYLVCSGYKIFAPHMGFMWGRYESLCALPTFREDFIPDEPPGKIEAGTFIFENVAGMEAAVQYLGELGRAIAGKSGAPEAHSLREDVRQGMMAIRDYEQRLSLELLRVLRESGAKIFGLDSDARVAQRVPTIAFNMPGHLPQAVTEAAARAEIGIRDGHMYSPRLMRRLGLAVETGLVRVSLVHYNTIAEIHRFGEVLRQLR
ncbi:MAG TPA: cysteine desulfurase-like protein [Steroidobacteraceae bacterium]|jgi:cysteine desulfurase family protein (TIGR01976 family)